MTDQRHQRLPCYNLTGSVSRTIRTGLTPPREAHSRQIEPPIDTSDACTGHSQTFRAWLGTVQYLRYRLAGVAPHSTLGNTRALHGSARGMLMRATASPMSITPGTRSPRPRCQYRPQLEASLRLPVYARTRAGTPLSYLPPYRTPGYRRYPSWLYLAQT